MAEPPVHEALRDAPTAAERLRRRTRGAHERTEAAVEARFFAGGSGTQGGATAIDGAGFRRLLEAFWGVHRPLDRRLEEAVARHLPGWEHAPRSARVRRDLRTLGLSTGAIARLPTTSPEAFPALDGAAPLLGCLYVVEGSELGARVIRRRLEAALAGTPDAPALEADAFFGADAAATRARWLCFRDLLDRGLEDGGAALEAAVEAARATFGIFRRWLG